MRFRLGRAEPDMQFRKRDFEVSVEVDQLDPAFAIEFADVILPR